MKQGQASVQGSDKKSEPISTTINPRGVAQIGLCQGNVRIDVYGERHGQAPQSQNEIYHHGTQGKR